MSAPHRFVIDAPARRSARLRWRDHCLTLVLWAVWGDPIDALARLAIGERSVSADTLWAAFTTDLATMMGVAGLLVSLLLGWGAWATCGLKSSLRGADSMAQDHGRHWRAGHRWTLELTRFIAFTARAIAS